MSAFVLICYLGFKMEGKIHFKNINDCLSYKNKLNNQTIFKGKKEQVYQCMCKLVPQIDDKKMRVY